MRLPSKCVFFRSGPLSTAPTDGFPVPAIWLSCSDTALNFSSTSFRCSFDDGDFFFLRHVLKRANKGLCEPYLLAFHSTAAP